MAKETLDHMRQGGIYDHIGGGFHRYSTDARWLVPHFEKTLYDNADLAVAYLEAAAATSNRRYINTAREILDYLLRDMRSPNGTFYSATDADSATDAEHHAEGIYFTWTPAELRAALGDDDARVAKAWFGVTESGQVDGRSVLHTQRSLSDVAGELAMTSESLESRLTNIRQRLLARRVKRPAPLRDDKVIVAWNAMAIGALARSAIMLSDAHYAQAAIQAAKVLVSPFGRNKELPHFYSAEQPHGRGFADDYVFLASALLDVFELTNHSSWLEQAAALMEHVERSFADVGRGGYYLTSARHEQLFVREKPDYDGPVPSVNSVAALTWLRLYSLTDQDRYRKLAETTMRAFSRMLGAHPLGLDRMLLSLDWATDAVKEIAIIVADGQGALTVSAKPFIEALAKHFVPNSVLIVATQSDAQGKLGYLVPWIRDKKLLGGQTTAYVCERRACKLPTRSPEVFAKQVASVQTYP